jgi:ATP-dependent Clp protease ATP-binding subunit ClpC
MTSPSIYISWRIAEIEASHAGFSEIRPAHFWLGICKVVDLSVPELLQDCDAEIRAMEGQVELDLSEVREIFSDLGVSAKLFRRALRAELGKGEGEGERPLHRSDELRKIFKDAAKMAATESERMRPMHLIYVMAKLMPEKVMLALNNAGYNGAMVRRDLIRWKREKRVPNGEAPDPKEKKVAMTALEKFGRNLTELAAKGVLPPLIGRRAEMLKISQVLLQSRKNNLILVGEPGVGKTGIVEGFAQLLNDGKLPEGLGKPALIEISLSSLVAGTKYRGEFEERLEAIIKEASSEPKPILFIDEIHLLLGAGSASGSMDAANILKPALARGAIRVIGATTIKEYRQTIEKDGALERRFQAVRIEEPSAEETVEILMALRARMQEHHGVTLTDEALRAAVEGSIRYLPDFRLPDKALDLVDQACVAARFQTFSPDKRALSTTIGKEQIAQALAARCGIPISAITADEGQRLMSLESDLAQRVKGQDEATSAVAEAVRFARTGLKKPGRPVGVFLFVGPSGTGKTELAKALAENLFHDERRLIRFDMSEFMEEHSVAKLIGSPPGYVGHDEGGQLSDAIRTHPYSVVLFDEMEKAHPKVLDLFLQIFDEGKLTDAQGRKCDFREAVIILTSNLGTGGVVKRRLGFGAEEDAGGEQDARATVEEAIRKHLRPELVNRLTKIVHFNPLGLETVREILDKLIADLNLRLADRGVSVSLSSEAQELILQKGFNTQYGARNLERVVDQMLGNLIAEALLSGKIITGQTIRLGVSAGQIQMEHSRA